MDKMDIDYPEYPKSLNEKDFSIISNKSEFNSVILNYLNIFHRKIEQIQKVHLTRL